MREPTGVKFCTVVNTRPNFIMPVQIFFEGGARPKKFLGAKNMQNLARFWTTLKFGSEYLQNGGRYSKLNKYFCPKISVLAARTLKPKGVPLWDFVTSRAAKWG